LIPDETMLLKIAVHPDFRRLGIGSRLLSESLEYLISRGIRVVWLEVRATNLAAQAFYQAFGFTFFHTRKRYYSDTGEDALIMARLLKTEEDVK
jgi:ribosomal-protein-alanine N-acetyltransferase